MPCASCTACAGLPALPTRAARTAGIVHKRCKTAAPAGAHLAKQNLAKKAPGSTWSTHAPHSTLVGRCHPPPPSGCVTYRAVPQAPQPVPSTSPLTRQPACVWAVGRCFPLSWSSSAEREKDASMPFYMSTCAAWAGRLAAWRAGGLAGGRRRTAAERYSVDDAGTGTGAR